MPLPLVGDYAGDIKVHESLELAKDALGLFRFSAYLVTPGNPRYWRIMAMDNDKNSVSFDVSLDGKIASGAAQNG